MMSLKLRSYSALAWVTTASMAVPFVIGCSGGSNDGSGGRGSNSVPPAGTDGAASVRVDVSGFETIPNDAISTVDELPERSLAGAGGLIPDPDIAGGYRMAFRSGGDRGGELEFRVHRIFAGTYDLANVDGELDVRGLGLGTGVYTTGVDGGYGELELRAGSDGRVEGTFSGRVCGRDTPGFNCVSLYAGELTTVNRSEQPLTMPVAVTPAPGYPQVNDVERSRVVWGEEAEATSPLGLSLSLGLFEMVVETAAGPDDEAEQLSFFFPSLEPQSFETAMTGANMLFSNGNPYSYSTSVEGGGGSLSIDGNDGTVVWGSFDLRVCYSQTPGANCFEFPDGRFTSFID